MPFSDTLEASEFWGIVWSRFILNGLAPVSALERAKEPRVLELTHGQGREERPADEE